jgi:hypothetical protein
MNRACVSLTALVITHLLAGLVTTCPAYGQPPSSRRVDELLDSLNDQSASNRRVAAEDLAWRDQSGITEALAKRLAQESDPSTVNAIRFALAFHGDKKAFHKLEESLNQGDLRVNSYLATVSGRDFGSNKALWYKWSERTSDDKFQELVQDTRTWRDQRRFGEVCVPSATKALESLKGSDDLEKTAELFRKVDDRGASEIADLLEAMAAEDAKWKEPDDMSKLAVADKIAYNIYHLRNVRCSQVSQPGMCRLLVPFHQDKENAYNAAIELRKIGRPAVPHLIELLRDRRPIKSLWFSRDFFPERTVLRYQDAAVQILAELLPTDFFSGQTTLFLSTAAPARRYKFIAWMDEWYQKSKDKPEAEQMWVAIKMDPGIHPTLALLRKLADDHEQEKKVRVELHNIYESRPAIYQPIIAEQLARLGDQSKVEEVLKRHRNGEYAPPVRPPGDDSGAAGDAEECAKRLLKAYGPGKQ